MLQADVEDCLCPASHSPLSEDRRPDAASRAPFGVAITGVGSHRIGLTGVSLAPRMPTTGGGAGLWCGMFPPGHSAQSGWCPSHFRYS